MNTGKRILLLAFAFFFLQRSFSQSLSAEQNYARNSPGIVMVQAVFSANVYVNKVDLNERQFTNLVDSVKRLDTTGNLLSPEQKLDMVVKALYRTPLRFMTATDEYFRQAHRVQANGTGFIVTGDGYLVTNCHIIDRDSNYIRSKFVLTTFKEVIEQNINSLQSSWAMKLSQEQRDLLYNAYGLIYSQVSSLIIFDLKKSIEVLYRVDDENGEPKVMKRPASVVIKGSPMPGKDVAILKIDNVDNLPTLTFSNESIARIGTQVLVFGFPEPVLTNSFLVSDGGLEPSLTSGIVSATRRTLQGWPVIQMDADISHGSSGSPVCNEKGEVVGLATFGSLQQGGNSLASGFNFAIPVSVMNEYLDSASLKPEASQASILYNEGLSFFYQQYFRKALKKFERVERLNPGYPQLQFYIGQCENKINRGADKQSPPRSYVILIMTVIALLTGGYLIYKHKLLQKL